MYFGFTNDRARFDAAGAWRDAAAADGWSIEPTYSREGIDRAAKLRRDGFIAMILTRTLDGARSSRKFEVAVHVWGPDGMAIKVSSPYDWQAIQAGVTTCSHCGKCPVETHRVGFAGRVCAECLPGQRKIIETPGWTN